MLSILATIITAFPPNDLDSDGVPDAVDNCLFFPNPQGVSCTDAGATLPVWDTFGRVDVINGEVVVTIRNLAEQVALIPDADSDGIPDYKDACVYTAGVCNYDLNGDGRMSSADLAAWKRDKQDYDGDGDTDKADRKILKYAIRKGIRHGVSCEYTPDSSAELDGISVCRHVRSIGL